MTDPTTLKGIVWALAYGLSGLLVYAALGRDTSQMAAALVIGGFGFAAGWFWRGHGR